MRGQLNQRVTSSASPHPNPLPKGEGVNGTAVSLAPMYITFSRCVQSYSKASKGRCSTPTASFDNADCGTAHNGLSF